MPFLCPHYIGLLSASLAVLAIANESRFLSHFAMISEMALVVVAVVNEDDGDEYVTKSQMNDDL